MSLRMAYSYPFGQPTLGSQSNIVPTGEVARQQEHIRPLESPLYTVIGSQNSARTFNTGLMAQELPTPVTCTQASTSQDKTSNENFEVQYLKLLDLFPNADTDFLWRECKKRGGNEEAINAFVTELLENNVDTIQGRNMSNKELHYQKLLEMIPDADPGYLWKQCSLIDNDSRLQEFIDEALVHRSYPKLKTNNKHPNFEKCYQKLLNLFPDADPGYLWTQCELRVHDEQGMGAFISHAQQHHNYPKHTDIDRFDRDKLELQYQRLLELFPDADANYLWEQCKQRVNDDRSMEDFIRFSKQYLDYPKQPDELKPKLAIEGVDNVLQEVVSFQYHYLLEMLPNADPQYLLKKCKEFLGDENALQNFISDALENEDYPTIENHIETQKANMLVKKYFENFYAEDFMKIFPDPWKFFLEEKPGNKDPCLLALEYLEKRYSCKSFDPQVVKDTYKKNKHRLAPTCKELDSSNYVQVEKTWNILSSMKNLTVPFVQEVVFIEYEKRIKDYIEFRKMVRDKAFARARKAGTLLECACCYNAELLPEDVTSCSSGHLFCVECVTRGAETWIGEGRTRFPCYVGDNCTGEFSLATLQCVLKPSVYSSLLLRKQMNELKEAGISEIESCPFCDYVTIPPEEDKVFHCLNPLCMKDSCRKCKEPSHVPLRCNEVEKPEEIRLRNYIEDKMTEALVRECYKCKKKFIKQDGCNKMTCTCGAKMCYLCRQPINDYSHFERGLCVLYSKNEELHVTAVMREGRIAREQALKLNPGVQLKNDPTVIPPK